jgi:hypothetical protein
MVSRDAVLAKAQGWLGMREQPDGSNNIEFSRDWGIVGQSWCFAFVQSCFYYADPTPSGKLPHQSMYCPYGIQWARDNGQAIEVGQGDPLPGDIVFFSWDMGTWPRNRPGTGDHVGIVESWDGGDWINTIEGNVGPRDGVSSPQGVWRRQRSISGTVVCFWRPTVFDGDSFGVAGTTPAPTQEEDVTPEQAQKLTTIDERTLYLQGLIQSIYNSEAADAARDDAANASLGQMAAQAAELRTLVQQVKDLGVAGGPPAPVLPPVRVVDVEASLKQASPAQLIAELTRQLAPAHDA